jgi:hypothetical protein
MIGTAIFFNAKLRKWYDVMNIKGAAKFRLMCATMLAGVLIALAGLLSLRSPVWTVVGFIATFPAICSVAAQPLILAFAGAKDVFLSFVPMLGAKEGLSAVFAFKLNISEKCPAFTVTEMSSPISDGASITSGFSATISTGYHIAAIVRLVVSALLCFLRAPFTETIFVPAKYMFDLLKIRAGDLDGIITPSTFNSNRAALPGWTMLAVISSLAAFHKFLLSFRDSLTVCIRQIRSLGDWSGVILVSPARNVKLDHPTAHSGHVNAVSLTNLASRKVVLPIKPMESFLVRSLLCHSSIVTRSGALSR